MSKQDSNVNMSVRLQPESENMAANEFMDTLNPGEHISERESLLSRTSLSPYQIACLKDIPLTIIRKAWFTISHLLLEPNAMVAIMGCGDGRFPYAMAVLNPDFHIIGLDSNPRIVTDARKNWQMTNLEFVVSRLSKPSFPNNSLDAVVDSFTLHDIYSREGFSDGRARQLLESHFALLKHNGTLFLRDYIHPPPEDFVLIEFPDTPSKGTDIKDLSEADLLIRFSEEALGHENAGHGFFLEEIAPIKDKTRLFRLPYKWAYEFILHKENRKEWGHEVLKEYTFMTARDFQKILHSFSARVIYTSPFWDYPTIRNQYEGHFQLYDEDQQSLSYPATSHVFIARKVANGESISLQERRPSHDPVRGISIESVRNTTTGGIIDLVKRNNEVVEFLPYRVAENGRLHIFLNDGHPRAITNAIARSGKNLDDKRWSGHMIEAISVDRVALSDYDYTPWTVPASKNFSIKHLGLKPVQGKAIEIGPEFYPDPSMIDERIETHFLHVQKPMRTLTPRWINQMSENYVEAGKIKEFDAQHVLNAINVGFIPNIRLERQILALFSMLNITADNWADSPLHLEETNIEGTSLNDLLKILNDDKKVFEKSENPAGTIRSLHSYFIEEGSESGVVRGLAAHDLEFVIKEGNTVNTAVVLPLCRDLNGEVLAGYIQSYLPVPERMGKTGKTICAPTFNLPPEVKDMHMAKSFIAKQFDVDVSRVMELGESYYIHNTITPQRVYPFAVTAAVKGEAGPNGITEYAPIANLWKLIWFLYEDSFAVTIKKAIERMHVNIDYGLDRSKGWNLGQQDAHWTTPPPVGMPLPSSAKQYEVLATQHKSNNTLDFADKNAQKTPRKTPVLER